MLSGSKGGIVISIDTGALTVTDKAGKVFCGTPFLLSAPADRRGQPGCPAATLSSEARPLALSGSATPVHACVGHLSSDGSDGCCAQYAGGRASPCMCHACGS